MGTLFDEAMLLAKSGELEKWAEKRVAVFLVNKDGRLAIEVMLGSEKTFVVDAIAAVKCGLITEFIFQGADYLVDLVDAVEAFKDEIIGDNPELFPVHERQ